jgi:glutaconate CoA-transferase subunit B
MVIMRQTRRTFVERCDFRSSFGFGDGPGHRQRLGLRGSGPQSVITDLGVLAPDPDSCELVQVAVHPGVTVEQCKAATGWDLRVAGDLRRTAPPTALELDTLRRLQAP